MYDKAREKESRTQTIQINDLRKERKTIQIKIMIQKLISPKSGEMTANNFSKHYKSSLKYL